MDPKDIHKIDQALADLKGHFIPNLWHFYEGCLQEGFSEQQAFELTRTWMMIILGKKIE